MSRAQDQHVRAALLLLGLGLACKPIQEARADCLEAEDQCRPSLSGVSLDGSRVEESDLRGKVVVVNFWATWCAPCVREIPAFEAVWKRHQKDGLVVVGILTQDRASEDEVQAFAVARGITYPVLRDDGDYQRKFKLKNLLPSTFVYDRQGKLVLRRDGDTDESKLEAAVGPLLRP